MTFYLPLLLAVALAGCKDPTNDSVASGSTIGTTISDSTYTNSGDFIEQWDAYTSGEMKVITLTWSSSFVSIDGSYDGVTVTMDGTDVTIVSTAKKVQYVLSYVPEVALNQMTLLLSSPTLAIGTTYTLVSGGIYTASTASDAVLFHNLTNAGMLSSPTTLTTATLSSVVITVGNVSNDGGGGHPGGGGNPGGNPGGGGRPGGW